MVKLDDQGTVEWELFSTVYGVDEYVDVTLVSDALYAVGNARENSSIRYTGASFISRIDPAGELLWTEYVEPPESIGSIAALGDGVVVGHAPNTVVVLSPSGELRWTANIDALPGSQINALAIGPHASVIVAGPYDGGADLFTDIYVSRLEQP